MKGANLLIGLLSSAGNHKPGLRRLYCCLTVGQFFLVQDIRISIDVTLVAIGYWNFVEFKDVLN